MTLDLTGLLMKNFKDLACQCTADVITAGSKTCWTPGLMKTQVDKVS